jgi:Na+-translocating ferredoxin:NAD+ oxidoreductase RnfC subunit
VVIISLDILRGLIMPYHAGGGITTCCPVLHISRTLMWMYQPRLVKGVQIVPIRLVVDIKLLFIAKSNSYPF